MKAKVIATGEIIEVEKRGGYPNTVYASLDGNGFYLPYTLDFNLAPPHPEATISGWVARDQPINHIDKGNLTLFAKKPMRDYYDYNDLTYGFWSDNETPTIPLSAGLFPSLSWQDEPIEVEITIKPKKQ